MGVPYAEGIKTLRAANPTFAGSDEELYRQWLTQASDRTAIETPPKTYSAKEFLQNTAWDVPATIADNVAGLATLAAKLNPITQTQTALEIAPKIPGLVRAAWEGGKGLVRELGTEGPGPMLGRVADAAYERPVMTASMLSPVARAAHLPRVATALDVPAAVMRGAGAVAKRGGVGWMGGVAKIPSTLKEENPFDIREVLVREGILPTEGGAEKASRLIKAEQAQVRRTIDRSRGLVERRGPAGRLETPPPSEFEGQPIVQTGTGSVAGGMEPTSAPPVTREIPPAIAPPPLGVERTGTGWTAPQAIPVSPGPLTQETATSAQVARLAPGAIAPEMPSGAPGPAVPARTVEGPILPGTEELRAAIARIDPLADTDNAMRNALQRELAWVEAQAPTPMPVSRYDTVKSQLQDKVSYGVRQKELSNETLAAKKLAAGFRRVENAAVPAVEPRNARIGQLVAAEEAAQKAAQRYENYNRIPARLLWGLGSAAGLGTLTHSPGVGALGALPFFVDHPYFGGLGSMGMYRTGQALGTAGQLPSALGVTASAMRDALLARLNGSTEKP